MHRDDRRRLRAAAAEVATWVAQARHAAAWRTSIEDAVRRHLGALDARTVDVHRAGHLAWRVIPLARTDAALLHDLAARANLPEQTPAETDLLRRLTDRGARAVVEVRHLTTWRRFFAGRQRRAAAASAAQHLRTLHTWGGEQDLGATLRRLGTPVPRVPSAGLDVADVLDERLGLREDLGLWSRHGVARSSRHRLDQQGEQGQHSETARAGLIDQSWFGELPRALADLAAAVREEEPYVAAAQEGAATVREPVVEQELATTPVAELEQVSTDRLRIDLLAEHDYTSVADVLAHPAMERIPGIGDKTAASTRKAAHTLRGLLREATPVRIDPEHRTMEAEQLLAALAVWDARRRTRGAADDLALAEELAPLGPALGEGTTHAIVLPVGGTRASVLQDAIMTVVRRADLVAGTAPSPGTPPPTDPWADFLARPADYHAMLAELGCLSEDEESTHGELPRGLVDTIRAQELRTDHLEVTLRGYQAFAARFALVQRRVIIGDEMGLGKTIEALAVIAHLWATGAQHFLVVCPAGVVTNWMREIERRTSVPAHRLHVPYDDRADAERGWREQGGVAVTSVDSLGTFQFRMDEVPALACVVVDEAHYIKNPETYRARFSRELMARSERAVLLTGTPMENHVDDFTTLVSYLRPDLLPDDADLAPRLFRREVAPAYLRRNAEDVLAELPDLVEVEEWLPMSDADRAAYRDAVADGNFAAMRRAALLHGRKSPKVARLLELVAEAEENDRRVVVFSYFREVIAHLAEQLPAPVYGPLTGDVAPDTRQRIIDDFSAAEHGAVLLSQITTGGVGLNIQAASVVVICEPQLKPTTEAQAIARAHRMGQLRTVQVHRLLSEAAVDERITEALAEKRRLFEEFAGASTLAEATPEAVEFSDAELGRQIVAAEQERLLYTPPEVATPEH